MSFADSSEKSLEFLEAQSSCPFDGLNQIAAYPSYIKYPGAASHAEIQAFLWAELCKVGLDAHLEVKVHFPGRKWGAVDLVVFDQDKLPIFGIEIKKHTRKAVWIQAGGKTRKIHPQYDVRRQVARYEETGLPIDVIFGMKDARAYISNQTFRNHL